MLLLLFLTRFLTFNSLHLPGVLQELGSSDQECVSQREAERYVVKMDQSAQAQIDNLIQEAQSNSCTLYILVHDHAHWDVCRFARKGGKNTQIPTNIVLTFHCLFSVFNNRVDSASVAPFPLFLSSSCCSTDSGVGLVDKLLNSRQVTEATNILILHVTSFPFALQTQCTRISPYNEINWPSAFSNVSFIYDFWWNI